MWSGGHPGRMGGANQQSRPPLLTFWIHGGQACVSRAPSDTCAPLHACKRWRLGNGLVCTPYSYRLWETTFPSRQNRLSASSHNISTVCHHCIRKLFMTTHFSRAMVSMRVEGTISCCMAWNRVEFPPKQTLHSAHMRNNLHSSDPFQQLLELGNHLC